MALTYELISSQEISSSVSTVTFDNIPQTYTDLVFWISARSSVTSAFYGGGTYRINDATSGYGNRRVITDGTMSAGGDLNQIANLWGFISTAQTTAYMFSPVWLFLPNYRSTLKKTTAAEWALTNPAGSQFLLGTIANESDVTTAITKVQFLDPFGGYLNTLQYSTFRLYGILKA